MLSRGVEVTAVKRVLCFLDREQFLHGGYVIVIEEACPDSLNGYALVIPSTRVLVPTVGLHLYDLSSTWRKSRVPHWGIRLTQRLFLGLDYLTFLNGPKNLGAIIAPDSYELIGGVVSQAESF